MGSVSLIPRPSLLNQGEPGNKAKAIILHVIKSTVVSIYYTRGNHDHQIKKLIP